MDDTSGGGVRCDTGWTYRQTDPDGGAEGEAYRIVINGSGFDAAERAARDAVQNSVDAARIEPGGRSEPSVSFVLKDLQGDERDAFRKASGLDDLAARGALLELPAPNALTDPHDSLRVLYVIDRGTTGLSGDPTKPSSKLRRLLMQIGGSRKLTEDGASGGSYGFGKAVYAGSSRIATIFAYSRTTDETGRRLSLLMGCSYHVGHEFEGAPTSGRGFFGRIFEDGPTGRRHDPFVGKDADDLADKLGMAREAEDVGTTIAIVDCVLRIADIRRGVEKWWWPRMLRDRFRVELHDTDGSKSVPRPKMQPEIRPFYDAMEVALGTAPEQRGSTKQKRFSALAGRRLGTLGLIVRLDGAEENEDGEMPPEANTIAMVRRPGMVVYHFSKNSANRNDAPSIAGVFLADEEIDKVLTRSEPPEHDRWDEKADRLLTDDDRDVVSTVKKRVWNEFRAFKKDAKPPTPRSTDRISDLERSLGRLLGPATRRSQTGSGASETPISIVPDVAVSAKGSGLSVDGTVRIGLKDDAVAQEVDVSISLRAIGEGDFRMDRIRVHVTGHDGVVWREGEARGRMALTPGQAVVLTVASAVYDRNWRVEFLPSVEPVPASGASS